MRGWEVTLEQASLRPERRHVHVDHRLEDSERNEGCCVGYSEDEAEADMLFEATVRTVCLVLTGRAESADWAEVPPGFPLI